MIGFGFEAFVFAYLGLSFFSYVDTENWNYSWSWSFILVELFICIVARFTGVVGLMNLLVLLRHKADITFRQQIFMSYAGMIRGAIAFGLVLQLNNNLIKDEPTRTVIKTTALTLVIFTTLLFGTLMPIV